MGSLPFEGGKLALAPQLASVEVVRPGGALDERNAVEPSRPVAPEAAGCCRSSREYLQEDPEHQESEDSEKEWPQPAEGGPGD
tara:strand:+ start:726 stop:974 length:249 start_codon:yes stop_codon:yes gene_type:complete